MRKLAALFCCLGIALFFSRTAAAGEVDPLVKEQLRQSGIEQLLPLIPEEGRLAAERAGETEKWTPQSVFSEIWNAVRQEAAAPVRLFVTISGIFLLAALMGSLREGMEAGGCGAAFSAAVSLAVSASLVSQVTALIRSSAEMVTGLSRFVLSFIPVFSGAAAAAGRPASAAVYQSVTFAAVQFFSQAASGAVVPLLGIFLAVCTVGSISDTAEVQGLVQGIRKTASWILALCLTVFVGLLSVQSLAAGAADTVGNRTLRFVISSAIPVVGGALSEAYGSLSGCLGVVKSTIGIFGIVVMAACLLPPVLKLLLTMMALNLAGSVGGMLGEDRAAGIVRSVSSALSILLGLIICYGMMILVSVAMILMMGSPD